MFKDVIRETEGRVVMNPLITLAALTGPPESRPSRVPVRPIEPGDLPEVARVYSRAYVGDAASGHGGDPGRIRALFDGVHGCPVTEASLVAAAPDGRIAAAIITTDTTSGTEKSTAAFIAELFTDPDHRRQGLAEELLHHCMHTLHSIGRGTVAVTIDSSNAAAMALYLSRDFRRLTIGGVVRSLVRFDKAS
ncbi:GNAT family N-acetyltransferase [Pseudarthrobacter sp. NPDC080039]|uniref:GNAT family N-acetyltransferase n=1 Tax=unclassified Pseudarthrobacter TaxID=2647000 RepID=UPI00344B832D